MVDLLVQTLADEVADDGLLSLREAIALANSEPGADRISFVPEVQGKLTLTKGAFTLADDVEIDGDIDGDGTADIVLDAQGVSRIIQADGAIAVALNGLTLTGGYAYDGGGAVRTIGAEVSITNSSLTNNAAYLGGGGAISVSDGSLSISGSMLASNTSLYAGGGGAVHVSDGVLQITGSQVLENDSLGSSGGAISGHDADITVETSTFSRNKSALDGGVINAEGGSLTLVQSSFTDNESGQYGGAVAGTVTNLLLSGATFARNAALYGGALALLGKFDAELINTTFAGNTAESGGALFASDGALSITNSTFTGNTANSGYGGGLYTASGTVSIGNSLLVGNLAGAGPADLYGTAALIGSNVLGGGLYNVSARTADVSAADVFEIVSGGAGVLAQNGGPVETVALKENSPVLDLGDRSLLPTDPTDLDKDGVTDETIPLDATGQMRLSGVGLDLGAFELDQIVRHQMD